MSEHSPWSFDEDVRLDTRALSRSLRCDFELIVSLVNEGVLEPQGESPSDWWFAGESVPRARRAVRLAVDLGVNPPGIALALQLLDEIDALEAALARQGRVT